jgi:RNA polymerase sigma-70 factor (ECF subfamily)
MNTPTQSRLTNDAVLAQQARTDVDAFTELYCRHVPRVYRYHMAHTGNVKDAEDLTSQPFIAALEGIRSFRGDGSFAAWIMGIAVRKKALFFRGRKPEAPLEAALNVPTPGLPTDKAAAQESNREGNGLFLCNALPCSSNLPVLSITGEAELFGIY